MACCTMRWKTNGRTDIDWGDPNKGVREPGVPAGVRHERVRRFGRATFLRRGEAGSLSDAMEKGVRELELSWALPRAKHFPLPRPHRLQNVFKGRLSRVPSLLLDKFFSKHTPDCKDD